ncbi:hypothetical protein [Microcoleus sp. F4-D5]
MRTDWVTDSTGDVIDIFYYFKETTGKMPVPQELNAVVEQASCLFNAPH